MIEEEEKKKDGNDQEQEDRDCITKTWEKEINDRRKNVSRSVETL